MIGTGAQHGPLRHDWGEGWADLKCDTCGATWVGVIGEQCTWCIDAVERQLRWQAELTLAAPDVDPDDARFVPVMTAWGQRLARSVTAEIITQAQAANAWRRARGSSSAA